MALTQCRECKQEISTDAEFCPHCGAPSPMKVALDGTGYEWKSKLTLYGIPVVHIAWGHTGDGRKRVAKGIIAIGQYGIGLITIAQFGVGILFGLGQFMLGFTAIAQFAGTILFGVGQFATGYIVIAQFGFGYYALCQLGFAKYIWNPMHRDPEVMLILKQIIDTIKKFIHLP